MHQKLKHVERCENIFFESLGAKVNYPIFALPKNIQRLDDSVAQLVEHDTFNVGVLGSSPSGITNHANAWFFYVPSTTLVSIFDQNLIKKAEQ